MLRLSSALWLGPSYLPPRPSHVFCREKSLLFDTATSYEASSYAEAGDVFLADSGLQVVDGFTMISVGFGAVEARFLRLASSKEASPDQSAQSLTSPSKLRVASGPGCIPWNSPLRPCLFPCLPVSKILRSKATVASRAALLRNGPVWDPLSVLRALGPHAESFWNLPLHDRNCLIRSLLWRSPCPCNRTFIDRHELAASNHPIPLSLLPQPAEDVSRHEIPKYGRMLHVVPGWSCQPIENGADSHCWWFSHADLTKQSPYHAMQEVLQYDVSPDVVGPVTNARHIQIAVSALHRWYPQGLLVVHVPAESCLLFLPWCAAQRVSFAGAKQWLDAFPRTLAMLYTEPHGTVLGHFVACHLRRQNSLDLCPTRWVPGHADLCGCGIFSDPVTSGPSSSAGSQKSVAATVLDSTQPSSLSSISEPSDDVAKGKQAAASKTASRGVGAKRKKLVASAGNKKVPEAKARVTKSPVRAPKMNHPLLFFPKWLPKDAACHQQHGPTASGLPKVNGGMMPRTPPQPSAGPAMYWQLIALGIPASIARAAAALHPDDINQALDWACASDRRHVRLAAVGSVEVVDSESDAGSPAVLGSSALVSSAASRLPLDLPVPSVPQSWISLVPAAGPAPGRLPSSPLTVSRGEDSNEQIDGVTGAAVPSVASSIPSVPGSAAISSVPAAGTAPEMPPSSPTANPPEEIREHIDDGAMLSSSPGRMNPPCYIDDPAGEVAAWFAILANSNGAAASAVWDRMPLYTEYIRSRSLDEVLCESLHCIQSYRGLSISIEQAAKMPRCLGQTTILPLAVACEYLHHGCRLPAIFAFDLFQACLASCQHKALEIALYAAKSTSFTCKARWWACPTGDPNAGKSPSCSFVMKSFSSLVESLPDSFFPDPHWIGVGNNNRIQNRLRALHGTLLLQGPESKPILDPHFPSKKTVDTGKYLDLTRWLESANGGRFEWGTGAEENERQKRKNATAATCSDQGAAGTPLVFDPTNINMCLFQQYSLFEEWWCQVEALHKCGFSARVLMTPTERAIVDRTLGLQDPAPISEFMQKIWAYVAKTHGPQCGTPLQQLRPSVLAQNAVRSMYYDLDEEDRKGGWGSAMKSALGKMEYHVPTAACLASLASCALEPASFSPVMDDNVMKCSVRHFVLRVPHLCCS